jgi:YopX protein
MKREIKFRVWDKYEGYFNSEYSINGMYVYGYCEGGQIPTEEQHKLIFMQFTGLKDKNGKEIYEGDVLRNTWNHRTFVVEWDEGEYPFQSDADSTANEWNVKYGGCEVIGNIYQNPELLK